MGCDDMKDRILIIIQLSGGNDGVNTSIPLDQYDLYANLRPKIRIPLKSLINLEKGNHSSRKIGLHPTMQGFKSLYDQGKLNVIQGVSYDQPNFSHFKSTNLWLSGGDGTPDYYEINSGWVGRFLDNAFAGQAGVPTKEFADPLGIQIGNDSPSLGFLSPNENNTAINLGYNMPSGFYNQLLDIRGKTPFIYPKSEYGKALECVTSVQNDAHAYAARIKEVFHRGTNVVTYAEKPLANQLKTIAKMISGGCRTKIFLVNQYGYDTHADQVDYRDATLGKHASLLNELSESVTTFISDLTSQNLDRNVLAVTFSEFGRKPGENKNLGTDHGTVAPMFLIGSAVRAGITGNAPDFTKIEDDLFTEFNVDYRQVFHSILEDYFGANNTVLQSTFFEKAHNPKLNLIRESSRIDPSCYTPTTFPDNQLIQFDARLMNEVVQVNWAISNAHKDNQYEVQRSKDNLKFISLSIQSEGNFNIRRSTYVDQYPLPGISYYRLKTIDSQGNISLSESNKIIIKTLEEKTFKIYPNPTIFDVNLVLNSKSSQQTKIILSDLKGRVLDECHWSLQQGFNKHKLDLSMRASGNYIIHFKLEENITLKAIVTKL
jgi:uncharacterized protein (DUF1501 family)